MQRCVGSPGTPCALAPRRIHLARSEPAVPATRLVPRVQTVRVPIRNATLDSLTHGRRDRRCASVHPAGSPRGKLPNAFALLLSVAREFSRRLSFPALDAKKLGLWSRRFPASRTPESRGRSLPQGPVESPARGSNLQAGVWNRPHAARPRCFAAPMGMTDTRRDARRPTAPRRRDVATGCRPGEIRCLRWPEVKPDRLTLIEAKTGPRHVLLGEAARELLERLAGSASREWVFPGENADEPLTTHALYGFWLMARNAAGIVADARLHDLRHAHASHAPRIRRPATSSCGADSLE